MGTNKGPEIFGHFSIYRYPSDRNISYFHNTHPSEKYLSPLTNCLISYLIRPICFPQFSKNLHLRMIKLCENFYITLISSIFSTLAVMIVDDTAVHFVEPPSSVKNNSHGSSDIDVNMLEINPGISLKLPNLSATHIKVAFIVFVVCGVCVVKEILGIA